MESFATTVVQHALVERPTPIRCAMRLRQGSKWQMQSKQRTERERERANGMEGIKECCPDTKALEFQTRKCANQNGEFKFTVECAVLRWSSRVLVLA